MCTCHLHLPETAVWGKKGRNATVRETALARGCCQLQIHLKLFQRLGRTSIKLTARPEAPGCLVTALVRTDMDQHITFNLTQLIN